MHPSPRPNPSQHHKWPLPDSRCDGPPWWWCPVWFPEGRNTCRLSVLAPSPAPLRHMKTLATCGLIVSSGRWCENKSHVVQSWSGFYLHMKIKAQPLSRLPWGDVLKVTWGLATGSWIAANCWKRSSLFERHFFLATCAHLDLQKHPDVVCYLIWGQNRPFAQRKNPIFAHKWNDVAVSIAGYAR